jgi:hypothetical protein
LQISSAALSICWCVWARDDPRELMSQESASLNHLCCRRCSELRAAVDEVGAILFADAVNIIQRWG